MTILEIRLSDIFIYSSQVIYASINVVFKQYQKNEKQIMCNFSHNKLTDNYY